MSGHTKGDWQYDSATQWVFAVSGDGEIDRDVCEVDWHDYAGAARRAEWVANGHLIAAAPDLLAELEAALDYVANYAPDRRDLETRFRAAISKARGGR